MMRSSLLWLSEQQQVFRFVRTNGLARRFARRFVAGETEAEAIAAARDLNSREITATLDLLGESVTRPEEAQRARDVYLSLLERIASTGVQANVSVKLTQMGLDIDPQLCLTNLRAILDRAKAQDCFVRLDMESSAYTQRTLDFFFDHIAPTHRTWCGVVIQSCLRRSAADIERLIEARVRVRLCKGAYLEPPEVAFPEKAEVDANYVRLTRRLLEAGTYPALATHDVRMIDQARAFVTERKLDPAGFEFQMLYGVRRDLHPVLRRQGYRVRIYIPFGSHWYPYLMRRLAERPANIAFMLANVAKEAVAGGR
jgi:proline dehydrogenase